MQNKLEKYCFQKVKLTFLLCSILLFQCIIFAQEKKKDLTAPETKKEILVEKKQSRQLYSFGQFGHETVLFVKHPSKWVSKDWFRLGMVTVATVAVMPFDEKIMNSTQGNQQFYTSAPIIGGKVYGEWYSIGGVAGVFGLYGILAKDTAAKKVSIELLQAGIYAELVTTVLKSFIGRARPVYTNNAFTFKPFTFFDNNFQSMPSGHTTSAMALSTIMSRHAHKTVFKILAYVPAGFTMFSRLYQNQHWLSDEVLAAAIGIFVGNWVVDLHEGRRHQINVKTVTPNAISFSIDRKKVKKVAAPETY
jgi:membrane-associated phospholipid phosphatase